jgi:uncharacterized protein
MGRQPDSVARFLSGKTLAVAGVSRDSKHAANAIFRRLQKSGYRVFPVNPNATEVEGARAYATIQAIPEPVDGVVIAVAPQAAPDVVEQCRAANVPRVWFHRSFGTGSVSGAAVDACGTHGIEALVGGCPLMYCEPVDPAHRCFRWLLAWRGRVPK